MKLLVEITLKDLLGQCGDASITLDGIPAYEGKITGRNFSFQIVDLEGASVLASSPELQGAFSGHGSHVMKDMRGVEVARVNYDGLFGFRRTCIVDGKAVNWPQGDRQHVTLPGATVTIDLHHRSARAEITDSANRIAYIGLAFYIWLRSDIWGG